MHMPYKVFESVFGLGFECFEFFERSKVAARAVGGACSTSDGRIVAVRRLWIGLLVGLCWLGLACVGCGLAVPCVGVAEALEALHRAAIPTALICDTGFTPSWVVREALRMHHLWLDHSFFSDEVGAPKPYPPMFLAALEATGAEPAEAVHIGDLRRTDVAGARAAGMAAVRFAGVHDDGWMPEDCKPDVEADAVLYRWADLPDLLGL